MKTNFLAIFTKAGSFAQPSHLKSGYTYSQKALKDPKRGNQVLVAVDRATFDSMRAGKGSLSILRPSRSAVADVDFEAEDGTLHKTAEECLAHELQARFGVSTLDELDAKWQSSAKPDLMKAARLADNIRGKTDSVVFVDEEVGSPATSDHQWVVTHDELRTDPLTIEELADPHDYEVAANVVSQNLQSLSQIMGTPGEILGIKLNPESAQEESDLDPDQQAADDAVRLIIASLASKGRNPAELQRDTGLPEAIVYNTLTNHPELFAKGPGGRWKRIE